MLRIGLYGQLTSIERDLDMKSLFKLFYIGSLFGIFVTAGAAESGAQNNTSCMDTGMGMGGMHQSMMNNMTDEQRDKHLRAKQAHMLKMHKLTNQILAETDGKKKEQLKQQQLDLMKEKMSKMRAKMAKSMADCNMNTRKPGRMIPGRN